MCFVRDMWQTSFNISRSKSKCFDSRSEMGKCTWCLQVALVSFQIHVDTILKSLLLVVVFSLTSFTSLSILPTAPVPVDRAGIQRPRLRTRISLSSDRWGIRSLRCVFLDDTDVCKLVHQTCVIHFRKIHAKTERVTQHKYVSVHQYVT